ncbi:glycosyltransferase [Halorubrum sp. AJ67]|uniref:glycosyltransferase n=1 Tax=Halorubrum sp. AJ67 TaxID=1173487 RepID=UPI0003DCD0AB|nr:glycosyltransferase [Halorubrum sp. AJ67]CDK40699.1 group 1 glycosyl transferase [Halorubrum sp. AJ67]
MTQDSVAVLHDRFPTIGGSETFAIEAARVLDAPIFTMYVEPSLDVPSDVEIHAICQPKYTRGLSGRLLDWKNNGMNPFESASVAIDMTQGCDELIKYDVLLESGPLSKFYVPETHQRIVHYPHSPPRWLYDLFRDRMKRLDYPGIAFGARAYAKLWRALDKEAVDYVDTFVGNSELIRDRIRRYYGRDAEVVYPPVTGDWRNEGDDGYFLTWSRLDPEKRVDLIVEAFQGLDHRLVVAGDGQERQKLERMSEGHDNIEIRGFVEDIESLAAKATAVVYTPRQEDFGLVGAETLSAGKPLLGVDEGFTKNQVEEGVTGLLFDPSVESLRETVRAFDPSQFDRETIQSVAEQYRYETFEADLREVVFESERRFKSN